ncbi:hypothetical protein GGE46_001927 [Rhizobium etli]|uniref:Uncharacterized protein n=1 Tax=Rhizobium etli TaxID=29449 RepID=A0A7W6Y906_RHIET|nr:hypothetical protein [Rhizobium etli]MBB4535419.1 hypothetical protein [Rhizobium etli]
MGEWAGVGEASPSPLGEKVPEGRMRGRLGKCELASARSFAPIVAHPLICPDKYRPGSSRGSRPVLRTPAGEKGERAS